MAQAIRTLQWTHSTELSVAQQAQASKVALSQRTSQEDAAKLGKQLIGLWPHANPPNPQAYSLGITKTLQKFPLGVAEECCDPTVGLAATREYVPTVAAVTEWCERRVKRHQGAIIHASKVAAEVQYSDAHRKTMLGRLRDLWKGLLKPVTQ